MLNHIHIFWYLYAFIFTLISWNSYLKFEVLIIFILTIFILSGIFDVVDFDSPWLNIYKNHTISMIRIPTLNYALEGSVFALLAALPFLLMCLFFFVNVATARIVNFYVWFESFESFISIIRIFLKLWIRMSRLINQTYSEWYEFDVNVVCILIATYTYNFVVSTNETE